MSGIIYDILQKSKLMQGIALLMLIALISTAFVFSSFYPNWNTILSINTLIIIALSIALFIFTLKTSFRRSSDSLTVKLLYEYFLLTYFISCIIMATLTKISVSEEETLDTLISLFDLRHVGIYQRLYIILVSITLIYSIYLWLSNNKSWSKVEELRINEAMANSDICNDKFTDIYVAEFVELFKKIDPKTMDIKITKDKLPYNMENFLNTSYFELRGYQDIKNMPSDSKIIMNWKSEEKYKQMKNLIEKAKKSSKESGSVNMNVENKKDTIKVVSIVHEYIVRVLLSYSIVTIVFDMLNESEDIISLKISWIIIVYVAIPHVQMLIKYLSQIWPMLKSKKSPLKKVQERQVKEIDQKY